MQMTTVQVPVSDDRTYPYRYYFSYAHEQGFGCAVLELNSPLHTWETIKSASNHLATIGELPWVTIISFQLIAGPPS